MHNFNTHNRTRGLPEGFGGWPAVSLDGKPGFYNLEGARDQRSTAIDEGYGG